MGSARGGRGYSVVCLEHIAILCIFFSGPLSSEYCIPQGPLGLWSKTSLHRRWDGLHADEAATGAVEDVRRDPFEADGEFGAEVDEEDEVDG